MAHRLHSANRLEDGLGAPVARTAKAYMPRVRFEWKRSRPKKIYGLRMTLPAHEAEVHGGTAQSRLMMVEIVPRMIPVTKPKMLKRRQRNLDLRIRAE